MVSRIEDSPFFKGGPPDVAPDARSPAELQGCAILLAAADARLCGDLSDPLRALDWAARLFGSLETDPLYAGGIHHGDCTKHAHTCTRCVVERYRAEALRRWEDDDG